MNKDRRNKISKLIDELDSISQLLEELEDEEQECLDNMPENLQDSERCQAMNNAIDSIDSALEYLNESINSLNEILDC